MDRFQKGAYRPGVCRSNKRDNINGNITHEALVYAAFELFVNSKRTVGTGNVWDSEAVRDHVVGIFPKENAYGVP